MFTAEFSGNETALVLWGVTDKVNTTTKMGINNRFIPNTNNIKLILNTY